MLIFCRSWWRFWHRLFQASLVHPWSRSELIHKKKNMPESVIFQIILCICFYLQVVNFLNKTRDRRLAVLIYWKNQDIEPLNCEQGPCVLDKLTTSTLTTTTWNNYKYEYKIFWPRFCTKNLHNLNDSFIAFKLHSYYQTIKTLKVFSK